MFNRALAIPFAVLTLTWSSTGKSTVSADVARPLIESLEADDVCLMPPTLEQRAEYQASIAAYQSQAGSRGGAEGGDARERPPDGPARTRSAATSRRPPR